MPGPHGNRVSAKPKNTVKTLKRILKYMHAYRLQLIVVVLSILVSTGASVAGTYLLKPIINLYIVPYIGNENPDMTGFISMIGIMAAIYAIGVLTTYIYNRLMINISTSTLYKLRTDLFTHMEALPIKYFDTHTHGELMSRYTNDIDTLREMISHGIPNLFSSALTVVGIFIMMLILSPALTALVVFIMMLMLLVMKKIGGLSATYFRNQQKEIGRLNGYIEEIIEGQKVVKVFNREENVKGNFAEMNEELCNAATNAHTFAGILMPIIGNLSYMLYALTAAVGGVMTIYGHLDIGSIASFLQYTRSFTQPLNQVSQQMNSILTALAGMERIFEVLDEKPEEDNGYVELVFAEENEKGELAETEKSTDKWAWKYPKKDGSVSYTKLEGDVRFEDVTFGYEEGKTVLNKVSLYAKPGQKIAFVGSTGAGKTTITNLINRFYDVPDGKIRYDGININKIKKADLRRSLSMVLQDTHLFTGTVMENIRYGKLDATDEEVVKAAKLANAHSFIQHLPEGYNTMLTSDGANLSQGQRQLLAIARAAVANPPVLILDEATSSIDTRTEALIEKGMNTLMEGRTVFVIAHRLSTVRNSDAIMVLENGTIIERGDHEDLIAAQGKYYQLYTGMFELS
ncbi:MAG: ABC transporter ATP-binding protein [Clostridiaceae bacterium]|nr:ABC transporter ATP-binding protein [Clostridiaceae bacterium]